MKRLLLCSLPVLVFTSSLFPQISFGGRPIGMKAEKLGLAKATTVDFPGVDAEALMAEDAERIASGVKGPYRFGFNHAADLSLDNSGTWDVLEDGTRLWRIELHCPAAFSINFVFGEYVIPEGAKVFVYNANGGQLGAFTQESSGGRHELGVTQLAGDKITVEYEEPAAVAGQGRLRITQVTHAYRDVLGSAKGLGDSGSCNNNVICPEGNDWRDQIAAVAMITVGGSGICTGTLVNNCANDGTPYFLTANHCTQGENVGTWSFRFNWESPTCTPTTNGPTNQTVSGATLLVNSGGSDVALLELNTTPPANYAVYYSGWDASGDTPSSQTCIHHPSGDIKKISFDNDAAAPGNFGGAQCWHILAWDDGTTEPGSSGSGLWDQNHRIIGQLFGGQANCSNNVNDYFGRFNVSYPLLTEWLGPCNVLDGFDPNSEPVGLDASIQSITGIDDDYCGTDVINPVLTLKNAGTTTLTSLVYSYDLDGGTPTTANWTGNLTAGQTTEVALGAINAGNGTHTFHASCSAPNGGTDENLGNNAKEKSFFVANPGADVTLNITLDDYGSEVTWQLADDQGAVLFSGGPYQDNASGTVVSATWCLSNGCYTLSMVDDYGDGICCQYGQGDYEVIGNAGEVLVDGNGDYGNGVSTEFCLNTVGVPEGIATGSFALYPNPSDGRFQLTVNDAVQGPVILAVTDLQGRELWRQSTAKRGIVPVDLSNLPSGSYQLSMITGNGRSVRTIIIAR